MSKIYKTFDEWMPDHGYYANVPVDIEMAFNDGQSSKQAEIEQLKHQITKLEFSEEDAQQYALKCKEEIEQLKARLLSFESRYTCFNCLHGKSCKFAFDEYNTNGDCLAEK